MAYALTHSKKDKRTRDYPKAEAMYRRGMSVGDVADYYSKTRQAMWVWLKRRGVKFRPNLRYGKENHFDRSGKRNSKLAMHLVEKAIKEGILLRRTVCETCGKNCVPANGRPQIEAHHDDYNYPLFVRWLCKKCHFRWHKTNKAVPLA